MDFKAMSRLFIDAVVIGFFGVCLALVGWLFAPMLVMTTRGDMLVGLSIVGSAFLVLGALSFISRQLSELIALLQKD